VVDECATHTETNGGSRDTDVNELAASPAGKPFWIAATAVTPLGKLLNDPTLYDEATLTLTALRESFGDIRKVTGRLERGEGTIGKLLIDDSMYDELRETVGNLNVTSRNFAEVSDQVKHGEGTIGRLVADDALYDQAEGALRGVTRATQGIEDQAPISVLGTLLGTLF